ncbi:MAG TPA: ribonuclease R [Kofleriaceae bacterium]|nr:ribonuclease R [Kofleriaceae bacterium]
MKLKPEKVLTVLGRSYTGHMSFPEIAEALRLPRRDQDLLRHVLADMVEAGEVDEVGPNGYTLARPGDGQPGRASGRIRVHPAGYGFVEREDGMGPVFVPAKYRGSALDGDRVLLSTWEGYKGTEGKVDKVLQRGRAKLTGVIASSGRAVYLEPDDPRISNDHGRIALEDGGRGARVGDSVVVEISQYPTQTRPRIVARLVKVLGDPDDPATEIEKIIACADIPDQFPDDALAQARATPQEVLERDLADRIDLRDRDFLTIDPENARDFDDAICIEDGPRGGPRVWVAVADVSHYVRPDDALDREAALRGVSVYLPDRVVPMLPHELSSGICSLNPQVDRCAMVVRLDFDKAGVVRDTGLAAAVIRSRARLDYPGVAAALSGDFRGRREQYRKWARPLERMNELAIRLRERRRARGTLELEVPEAKVVLDADDPRLVRDVVRAKDTEAVRGAYQLVEEYMIAANEAVGGFFASRGLHAVWRVHAPPAEDRVRELAELLEAFGIEVDVDEARTPLGMQKVLQAIEGTPAARSLSFLVLRSLKQAVYDTENVGHFGLASDQYLHFTSPIRRYPDLLVHRLLKVHLHREGQAAGGGGAHRPLSREELDELARDSSSHERRAIEAEREAVAMYRAYLMRDHVGEEFTGRVTGVQSFGVFVELDEPFIEGLIKLEGLGGDSWEHDDKHMRLRARRSGRTISLGDPVRVELIDVSVARRRVDFRLVSLEKADCS